MDPQAFFNKFRFDLSLIGARGIEREFVLVDQDGIPVPRGQEFLTRVDDERWTFELSACQVEHRTRPHISRDALREDLIAGQSQGQRVVEQLGLRLVAMEVTPEHLPLYVTPNERYRDMTKELSPLDLKNASRVAGVHIHRGAGNIEHALYIYNRVVERFDNLLQRGDHSAGERVRLYSSVVSNWRPPFYKSPRHFYEVACEQNFAEKPRRCLHLIRMSEYGTVELRTFGATESVDEVLGWADEVERIIA